jgi:outer membrane usher protein FimD/PapC
MKKHLVAIGIIFVLLIVGFGGCISPTTAIKITSVNIDENMQLKQSPFTQETYEIPYITYNVSITLENSEDYELEIKIELQVQYWNDERNQWQTDFSYNTDTRMLSIDARNSTSIKMNVSRYKEISDEEIQIGIVVSIPITGGWIISDSYEKKV